ncbi:aminopeptidase, partial [Paeniclostridium sordellii]|uniref:aminopeptidase n=1 Tax=Paraclostridium sordellii TaxID=1505 RepID=UPI00210B7644
HYTLYLKILLLYFPVLSLSFYHGLLLSQRVANFQKASAEALQEWRSYTLSDKSKWSIVSVPTANWSKKVFPGVSVEEAIDKMWEAIFHCTRVDQEDPIEAWN